MDSSHWRSGSVSCGSVISQAVRPSSITWGANSTRPCTDRNSVSEDCPGPSPVRIWELRVLSQDNRSGPLTQTTPLCDRSTIALPRASARCSLTGSP